MSALLRIIDFFLMIRFKCCFARTFERSEIIDTVKVDQTNSPIDEEDDGKVYPFW